MSATCHAINDVDSISLCVDLSNFNGTFLQLKKCTLISALVTYKLEFYVENGCFKSQFNRRFSAKFSIELRS